MASIKESTDQKPAENQTPQLSEEQVEKEKVANEKRQNGKNNSKQNGKRRYLHDTKNRDAKQNFSEP